MAHLIENSFASFSLTAEEELEGSIFTLTQLQYLQNQLAKVAEEKLELEFDTSDPQSFTQQEAYKRGQLDTLRFLLEVSKASLEVKNGIAPQ